MTKKIIGILLAVFMVISMLPVAVFATDEDVAVTTQEALLVALAQGGVIELGADITATQTLAIKKDTTVNGNGYTVTRDAAFKGDMVVVDTGVRAYLNNITFDGNKANVTDCGSLVDLSDNSIAVLDTVTCKNNDVAGNGGAVYVHDGARLAVFNSNFTENVSNFYAEPYYEGDELKYDNHDGDGGAIYVHGDNDKGVYSYAYITGSSFKNNTANVQSNGGGAVYGTYAKLDIEKTSFDLNMAYGTDEKGGNGGALGLYSGSVANIYDCTFGTTSTNTAKYRGGAIYLASSGTTCNIYSSTISKNAAGNYAGGLGCTTGTSANLYNTTFANNTADGTTDSTYFNAWFYKCSSAPLVYQCKVNGANASKSNMKYSTTAPTYSTTATLTSPFIASGSATAEDVFCTGEPIVPTVAVKFNGATADSANYDLFVSENSAVGTAKILVWAKNNNAGVIKGTFTIKAPPVATLTVNDVTTTYTTLADAIGAAPNDGTKATVTLLSNVVSNGISVASGKNLTIDLDKYTLTFDKPGAGSVGTTTQGFQFLEGSEITIKNGLITIAEDNKDFTWASTDTVKGIAMLIQNYASLNIENVSLIGTNIAHNGNNVRYILSNNSGIVNITGFSNILAPEGDFAFDTCLCSTYSAPSVTFDRYFTGNVYGNVELSGGQLSVYSGQFKGTFIKDSNTYSAGQVAIYGGLFTTDISEFCAEGYSALPNENGIYEILTAAEVIAQLKNSVADLKSKVELLNTEKENLNAEISTLIEQKTNLETQTTQLNEQIGTLTTANTELENQVTALTDDKTALNEQITALTTAKTELENSVTALENEINTLEASVLSLSTENGNLSNEVTELTAKLDTKTKEAEKLTADLTAKTTEAEKLSSDLDAKTKEAEALAATNAELQKQIDELKAENSTLKAENETLAAENKTLKEQNASLSTENTNLKAQINTINASLTTINAQLSTLTQKVSTLETSNTKLTKENAKLTAKTELLSANLNAKATVSGKTVTISWTAINGAKYEINGKTYTGTSAKFTVKAGSTNKYTVKAYKTVNGEKVYSKTTTLTAKVAPAKVATPGATSTVKTKAKATWTKAEGASYYQVSVSTSKTGTKIVTEKTTKLNYTATKLTSGKTYYVKVRAVAANGTVGAWSTVKAVKVK